MNHVALNHQIVTDKLGWKPVIGLNTPHSSRRQKNIFRRFASEEIFSRFLFGQVEPHKVQPFVKTIPLFPETEVCDPRFASQMSSDQILVAR